MARCFLIDQTFLEQRLHRLMFDMRRQNLRNRADAMTQHQPERDPTTFRASSQGIT